MSFVSISDQNWNNQPNRFIFGIFISEKTANYDDVYRLLKCKIADTITEFTLVKNVKRPKYISIHYYAILWKQYFLVFFGSFSLPLYLLDLFDGLKFLHLINDILFEEIFKGLVYNW